MWVLGVLSVFVCIGLNNGQNASLIKGDYRGNYANGVQLPNNSVTYFGQFYTFIPCDGYFKTCGSHVAMPLRCKLSASGNVSAVSKQWYGPTGAPVINTTRSALHPSSDGMVSLPLPGLDEFPDIAFVQLVGTTSVDLYPVKPFGEAEGIYRCDIVDENRTLHRLYFAICSLCGEVGVYYRAPKARCGPNGISGGIQFQQLTAPAVDPPVFQLSCTITHSPAITVQWTYNGSPANGSSFSSYQNVTVSTVIVTATDHLLSSTYNNVLVVRGKMAGVYTCTVTTLCVPACGRFIEQCSFTSSLTVQGQKVRLSWNGNELANNSMVSSYQLYTSKRHWTGSTYVSTYTYTPIRCELIGLNASATLRQWYNPWDNALPSSPPRNTSVNDWYMYWYGQELVQTTGVDLYSGGPFTIEGIRRCDITDGSGTLHRLYVAIYNDPSQVHSFAVSYYAQAGPNSISGIQFRQLTALAVDPAVFQLSCTSTYSPATTVQWTYNGSPANRSSFSSYQTVTDQLWSTYNNVLVVRGKMAGVYTCNVTTLCAPLCGGFVGQRYFTSSLTLQVPPGPPTQVTVSQTGPTSVRVSWIPSSGPTFGYYILSGSEGVATYTTASSVVPYYDMTTGSQTNNLITVGARGQYFTSSFTPVAPIITVATLTTVITLTWRQPVDPFGIGAVDSYKVYFNYVGPCPAIFHRGIQDLNSSATGLTLLGMQEYSTYNLTVTTMKNGGSSMLNIQVQTPTATPGAPPSTVYEVARSPTSLTVGWSSVPCIYQNSMIVKYSVRYGLPYGVMATAETTVYYFTATGLTPYTTYMFQVAAINSAGQRGPFSDSFIMETKLGPPTITKTQVLSPTSVLLSWMPSDGDGSTNYSVSYVYQGPCSVSIAGVGYTNATQYTIQGLEEYSSYAVTITAVRGGQVMMDNSTVVTMAAVPSAPPSGLVEISKTSTGATLGWGPVPCLSRNSNIREYRVRYINLNYRTSKQQDSFAMTFSTTGLNPYTNYSFEVAAVNTNGLVGPFSTPVIVKTLQPLPPVISIKTDGSSPTDQGNFSMTCSVSVPMEALGTLTVRWLGPLGPQVVLNSTVASNIGGATVVLGLVFSPITTRDGGWYTCDVTFELYPQAAASTRKKVTVQSDALFQLKLGPTDNCVQWPWSFVPVNDTEETKVDQVQRAVFSTVKSLLVKNYCSCEADSIDWIYSCQTSSSDVVFKYSLHLTSEHCNCSGSDVVSIMDQWVKSAGTVRMGRYQFRASQDCVSTKIVSFDDLECKKKL